MAELPRLPLDCAKLLADTSHLSEGEMGVYCRLLFTMWLHGAKLRDDDQELARIAGVTWGRWRKISERILRFFTFAGDQMSQKRLTATWLDVQALRRKHQDGANKRWRGHQNAPNGAEHRAQHKHIKESNIKPSDSESGAARARDAEAQQDSRGKNVASPQLQRILKTPSRAGDQ